MKDFLSVCCSSEVNLAGGAEGTNHAVCASCGHACDLKQKTLEIQVDDSIKLKDIGPGQK